MTHHGTVQPVLCHDAATAPGFLRLTPLGSSVLKPYLMATQQVNLCHIRNNVDNTTSSVAVLAFCQERPSMHGKALFVFPPLLVFSFLLSFFHSLALFFPFFTRSFAAAAKRTPHTCRYRLGEHSKLSHSRFRVQLRSKL